jgi:hypothetical protein
MQAKMAHRKEKKSTNWFFKSWMFSLEASRAREYLSYMLIAILDKKILNYKKFSFRCEIFQFLALVPNSQKKSGF